MAEPRLSLRGVSKRFYGRSGEVLALEDVRLDVRQGEFLILVGPSGCGKSTILNIVAGLERADAGEVLENGKPVSGPGRDRSVVFQDGALFPWLTAQKNVEFGLKQMGVGRRERAERARSYLRLVHLSRFADSYLHELSGGMRQRVALARALALEPQVLLMDEPFGALDSQTKQGLYGVIQEIWTKTGQTIVFVTHDVREAVCLGDRVVVLSSRPGRVKAEYPITLARPRHVEGVDVARKAQQIAHALRDDLAREQQEEYDLDWQPAESGVLRSADSVMGDNI
jgi:NitT/TauT family transport system ATP-binding protein